MSKTQDLSIEEILASIRGIVQDSSAGKAKTIRRDRVDDVLELTELRYPDEAINESAELVSEKVVEEVSETLRNFAEHTSKMEPGVSKSSGDKTVESFMLEMLRSEVKKWLDINLPLIVRQLVEREIRRLVPKG